MEGSQETEGDRRARGGEVKMKPTNKGKTQNKPSQRKSKLSLDLGEETVLFHISKDSLATQRNKPQIHATIGQDSGHIVLSKGRWT